MSDPRIEIYMLNGRSGQSYHARLLNKHDIEIHQNLITPQASEALAIIKLRALRDNFLKLKHIYLSDKKKIEII